jgi:hypothetical protein
LIFVLIGEKLSLMKLQTVNQEIVQKSDNYCNEHDDKNSDFNLPVHSYQIQPLGQIIRQEKRRNPNPNVYHNYQEQNDIAPYSFSPGPRLVQKQHQCRGLNIVTDKQYGG